MNYWSALLLLPDSSLGDAIAKIDAGGMQIALLVDGDGTLLGTITDGDVRRALLRGLTLSTPATDIMNRSPITGAVGDDRASILATLKQRGIHQIPLIDSMGRVVGLETLDELLSPRRYDNLVVLMAGGEGRRLRPLTNDIPKPMIQIGNKPLLESIIDNFIACGFWRFAIAVNYKADLIQNYFGDGSKWNVDISYLRESEKLGTAGALALITEPPAEPFIVMNADILTNVGFGNILDFHRSSGAIATVCVREYAYAIPYGVIRMDNNEVTAIEEKPVQRSMVSAGIYVINPSALTLLQAGKPLDMPDLLETLMREQQRVAGFPIHEYWIDIGRHEDLQNAQRYLLTQDD